MLTQPYKKAVSHYIKTYRAFLILYAMFIMAIYGTNVANFKDYNFSKFFYSVDFALSLFPLLCILVLMLRSVFLRRRFFLDLVHSIRSLCRGYTAMDEDPTVTGLPTLPTLVLLVVTWRTAPLSLDRVAKICEKGDLHSLLIIFDSCVSLLITL